MTGKGREAEEGLGKGRTGTPEPNVGKKTAVTGKPGPARGGTLSRDTGRRGRRRGRSQE